MKLLLFPLTEEGTNFCKKKKKRPFIPPNHRTGVELGFKLRVLKPLCLSGQDRLDRHQGSICFALSATTPAYFFMASPLLKREDAPLSFFLLQGVMGTSQNRQRSWWNCFLYHVPLNITQDTHTCFPSYFLCTITRLHLLLETAVCEGELPQPRLCPFQPWKDVINPSSMFIVS